MKPDWKDVPSWANWMGQTRYGYWIWSDEEPTWLAPLGSWERRPDASQADLDMQAERDDMTAIELILKEREAQDAKWGKQMHFDLFWLGILMEELGEVSKEIIENNGSEAIEGELIQVAAVAVAWLEWVLERQGK